MATTKSTKKPAPRKQVPRPAPAAVATEQRAATANGDAPQYENILGRAMLVNVSVSRWRAQKHDRDVTQQVNEDLHAADDAGVYLKHLLGRDCTALAEVRASGRAVRQAHKLETLPWDDDGWRLLPTANYTHYTDTLRKKIAEFNEKLEALLAVYPSLVDAAETRLGTNMFKRSDYPTAQQLRAKFGVTVNYSPIPAGSDFRVSLPQEELERVKAEVETRVTRAVEDAMRDAWDRLGELVERLTERLKDDAKGLRESLIDSLRSTCDALGRLNITQDPTLETVRKRVTEVLGTLDAETIRDDKKVRQVVAREVQDIMKAMTGLYTPAK